MPVVAVPHSTAPQSHNHGRKLECSFNLVLPAPLTGKLTPLQAHYSIYRPPNVEVLRPQSPNLGGGGAMGHLLIRCGERSGNTGVLRRD